MQNSNKDYDFVIAGAGLSGLTSAYYLKKIKPNLRILVLERSGTAGGLTGDWVDHRLGSKKRLQMPMHMIFREKYQNLISIVNEVGGEISPVFKGFDIITSNEKRHRLEMDDWASRNLPPPMHGLGMYLKLKLSLKQKWDLFKLGIVSAYCAKDILAGKMEPKLLPNTLSLESLGLLLGMGAESRDFLETVGPSIYNLHPWYTSAPRLAAVFAGTMMMTKNALHYHVFNKNYNAAFINRYVERLCSMGVEFSFWTEVRRLDSNSQGSAVEAVWAQKSSSEQNSTRYICDNCGAENYALDRAFCTRCGLDRTLDFICEGKIQKPVGSQLWQDPEKRGYTRIGCQHLITAMYPHMIAKLLPIDSPLRQHPYVQSCFSSRGNQTQLSVARIYYKKQVTNGDRKITGTHNPAYVFNGCQSVFNNFGAEDLDYHGGDVVDALLDVGIIRDAFHPQERIPKIIKDIQRVYPDADPSLVEHVSFANIYPDVLYLSEQPAITGLHRFFNTHRTGAKNWYVAGCHSGKIGIGMESAVESALSTVNCWLEDTGSPERTPLRPYELHRGCDIAAAFGKALLWWKSRGQSYQRLHKIS